MVRFITVVIGVLIFSTMTVILLSLIEYEYNRQVNNNMHEPNTSEEFYMNRVKLFAVPVDNASGEEFEKLDVLNWYEIRLEMLKYRKEIEALEIHQLNYDLAAIGLFSISFAGLMIYSPALWAAEYKFGNEIEKFLFNFTVCMMMISATIIRVYVYFGVIKRNYGPITERTRQVIERIGGIKYPNAIHFCYYAYDTNTKSQYALGQSDWHFFRPSTHLHMDNVAGAAKYCHPDQLDVAIMSFSIISVLVHIWLFFKTNRLGKSQLEYLHQMEKAENLFDPLTDSSEDDGEPGLHKRKKKKKEPEKKVVVKKKKMIPDRNPKSIFSSAPEDHDEKHNERAETMIETLMDEGQLRELREAYLSHYYLNEKDFNNTKKKDKK